MPDQIHVFHAVFCLGKTMQDYAHTIPQTVNALALNAHHDGHSDPLGGSQHYESHPHTPESVIKSFFVSPKLLQAPECPLRFFSE